MLFGTFCDWRKSSLNFILCRCVDIFCHMKFHFKCKFCMPVPGKIATQHNIIYTVRAENRRKVVIYKSQKSRIVTQEMRRSRLSAHREEAKKRQGQNNMLAHWECSMTKIAKTPNWWEVAHALHTQLHYDKALPVSPVWIEASLETCCPNSNSWNWNFLLAPSYGTARGRLDRNHASKHHIHYINQSTSN